MWFVLKTSQCADDRGSGGESAHDEIRGHIARHAATLLQSQFDLATCLLTRPALERAYESLPPSLKEADNSVLYVDILRLIQPFHVDAVAEYVETEPVAERLRLIGIDYGQGYVFGKPEPMGAASVTPGSMSLTRQEAHEQGSCAR